MKNKTYTRIDLYRNAMSNNKHLKLEYLSQLSWKRLLSYCHPDLRNEINELGNFLNK